MTRKDYVLIAESLAKARYFLNEPELASHAIIARVLAGNLEKDSPRFDRVRFLKACGLPDTDNIA